MNSYEISFSITRLLSFFAYLLSAVTMVVCLSFATHNFVVAQTEGLEVVAEFLAEHPPGNIAITPEGRIIMSQHQFYGASLRVVEVLDDGSVTPFPNEAWSSEPNKNGVGLNTVLGLRGDRQGIVWMLDRSAGEGQPGKIVAWDTESDELNRVIYLPQPIIVDSPSPFLNDLAVDLEHNAIYLTDTTSGIDSALIEHIPLKLDRTKIIANYCQTETANYLTSVLGLRNFEAIAFYQRLTNKLSFFTIYVFVPTQTTYI